MSYVFLHLSSALHSIALTMSVSLSVCLLTYLKNNVFSLKFTLQPVACDPQSSSNDSLIRYVLPFL